MALRMLTPAEQGDRIRDVRQAAKLGSTALSSELGEYRQFVSNLENGRRDAVASETLKAIAITCSRKGRLAEVDDEEIYKYLVGLIDHIEGIRPFRPAPRETGKSNPAAAVSQMSPDSRRAA